MAWWRRKKKDDEQQMGLEQKISQAITKCDDEKKKTAGEISQLKQWANEVIQKVFEVPHQFYYTELEHFDEIKKLNNTQNISEVVFRKTNDVVQGYKNQIRIRESKIELCENLLEEYYQSLNDYRRLTDNMNHRSTDDLILQELEQHANRIKNMNSSTDELEFSYEKTERLELIESDLKALEEEFKMKEEFHHQMNRVNEILADQGNNDLTEEYEAEIKNLINKIKHHGD